MADVERITPPVPTLPPPIGRGIPAERRRPKRPDRPPERERQPERSPDSPSEQPPTDHIDEYV